MNKAVRTIILLLITLIPTLAFAGDLFTVAPDDIGINILNQIFGGLLNGGNDAFGSSIGVFNGAILAIGGILATYTIIAGTLGTAHDGEMLGKQFSSIWIPIRYSVGTALILPILPGGYSVISGLVMWVVKQSFGLATAVWIGFLSVNGTGAQMTVPVSAKAQIQKIAQDAFNFSVCVASKNKAVANAKVTDPNDALNLQQYKYGISYDLNRVNYGYLKTQSSTSSIIGSMLVDTFVSGVPQQIDGSGTAPPSAYSCGQILIPNPPTQTGSAGPQQAPTTYKGYLGPIDNLFKPTDVSILGKIHHQEAFKLMAKMNNLAISAVNDPKSISAALLQSTINDATEEYYNNLNATVTSFKKTEDANSENAKDYGWIMAGSFFINKIVVNNKISTAIQSFPISKSVKDVENENATIEKDSSAIRWGIATSIGNSIGNVATSAFESFNGYKETEIKNRDSELWSQVSAKMGGWLVDIDLLKLNNDDRHPIMIINDMGNKLLSAWGIAVASIVAVATTAGIATLGTAGSGIIAVVAFIFAPVLALAAVGFMAAYMIPMMPFLIWLGCVGGVLIQIIIAIIVAPLWAVMHLHPSGDDPVGKGGSGYQMLLGILLRPTLLVFGLLAAITLSTVMGEFINKIFYQVFQFSEGSLNGALGFMGTLFGTIIYVGVMFKFIEKCFSIMHVIPDEMLRWIGGGGDSMASYAKTMGDGGHFQAAAGFVAGKGLGGGLQNLTQSVGGLSDGLANKGKLNMQSELEAANKANEKLDFDSRIDDKFGANASSTMNETLANSGEQGSASRLGAEGAYKRGLTQAHNANGADGVSSFENQMKESSQNNWNGGSAQSEAMKIGSEIAKGGAPTSKIGPQPPVPV